MKVDFTVLSHLHSPYDLTFIVMNKGKTNFKGIGMTSKQKVKATKVITGTHAKLDTYNVNVLGLEQGERTGQEVFTVLREFIASGNMMGEQNSQNLIIQSMVIFFSYTALLERPFYLK